MLPGVGREKCLQAGQGDTLIYNTSCLHSSLASVLTRPTLSIFPPYQHCEFCGLSGSSFAHDVIRSGSRRGIKRPLENRTAFVLTATATTASRHSSICPLQLVRLPPHHLILSSYTTVTQLPCHCNRLSSHLRDVHSHGHPAHGTRPLNVGHRQPHRPARVHHQLVSSGRTTSAG